MSKLTPETAESPMIKKEGPRRFNQSVDTSKTPEQEEQEAKAKPASKPPTSFGTK